MPTRIKEVSVLTRPNTNTPFYSPESMFWSATTADASPSYRYFSENYIATGKAVQDSSQPELSSDGLALSTTIIYNDISYLKDIYADEFYKNNNRIDGIHRSTNNIALQEFYYFADTNKPVSIKTLMTM